MAYVMKSIGWMSIAIMFCLVTACSLSVERPTDPKTVHEQLLISHALDKSLIDLTTEFPQGTTVALEVSGLTTDQNEKEDDVTQRHVRKVLSGWLRKQGLVIVEDSKEAAYQMQAILESIGTRQGVRFLGMPATNSSVLPIAIPELTLWKRNRQQGFVRFYFDIFETATGRASGVLKVYQTWRFENDVLSSSVFF